MINPSIGLILCKDKNRVVAEYALKDMTKPIGVSEYKLLEEISEELQSTIPAATIWESHVRQKRLWRQKKGWSQEKSEEKLDISRTKLS